MHDRARRAYVAELAEGGRRAAKSLDCPRCGMPIVQGDDHDTVAMLARVDATPIDRAAEMVAVLDGRLTFDLLPMRDKGGAFALYGRNREHYLSDRDYGGTIHVMHECKRNTLF